MDQKRNHKGNEKIIREEYNENTTQQNLGDAAKAIPRGRFIVMMQTLLKTRNISNEQSSFTT